MFVAKEKVIISSGWREYETQKETPSILPNVEEGDIFSVLKSSVKEGRTRSPQHLTEDTLLAAMDNASKCSEETERKGIGTPATRAGIIEKLISTGFVERRTDKKHTVLIPTSIGTSLVTVLPEQLRSPLLTADWEYKLK